MSRLPYQRLSNERLRPGRIQLRTCLLASLDVNALREAAEAARVREVPADAAFFRQGDAAASFFVVRTGTVKLTQLTPQGHQVVLRLIHSSERSAVLLPLVAEHTL
jgi:CRP-like cAMP-binding protein